MDKRMAADGRADPKREREREREREKRERKREREREGEDRARTAEPIREEHKRECHNIPRASVTAPALNTAAGRTQTWNRAQRSDRGP